MKRKELANLFIWFDTPPPPKKKKKAVISLQNLTSSGTLWNKLFALLNITTVQEKTDLSMQILTYCFSHDVIHPNDLSVIAKENRTS